MSPYLSRSDPTPRTVLWVVGEVVLAAGTGGLVTLGITVPVSPVPPASWWIAGGLILAGLGLWVADKFGRRHFDAAGWKPERWNRLRDREYERRSYLFLTHSVAPYRHPDDDTREWWTVTVQLHQHGRGPLKQGRVTRVEYALGDQFEEGPTYRQNPQDSFRFETELHGSVLVLARVFFTDRRPLLVERYIDVPPR